MVEDRGQPHATDDRLSRGGHEAPCTSYMQVEGPHFCPNHVCGLWDAYRRDRSDENRNKIVGLYYELANHIARRVAPWHPESRSESHLHLVRAVETYNPARGASFSTHCHLRVRGGLIDWLRVTGLASRVMYRRTKGNLPRLHYVANFDATLSKTGEVRYGDEWGALLRGLCLLDRLILRLHFYGHYTFEQLAEVFSMSSANIHRRYREAREHIEKRVLSEQKSAKTTTKGSNSC